VSRHRSERGKVVHLPNVTQDCAGMRNVGIIFRHGIRLESLHLECHFLKLLLQLEILLAQVKDFTTESIGGVGNFLHCRVVAAICTVDLESIQELLVINYSTPPTLSCASVIVKWIPGLTLLPRTSAIVIVVLIWTRMKARRYLMSGSAFGITIKLQITREIG